MASNAQSLYAAGDIPRNIMPRAAEHETFGLKVSDNVELGS